MVGWESLLILNESLSTSVFLRLTWSFVSADKAIKVIAKTRHLIDVFARIFIFMSISEIMTVIY